MQNAGTKIKELRSRTGTYIKTPVKDEEPVFIITGRKENIEMAKQEIFNIADKFTRMRSRKLYGSGVGHSNIFELVKMELSVPYDVVGLVVGPKGATIMQIQDVTQTYIKTPNRDQKPVFKISGSADNVLKAKDEIRSHVLMRTGKNLPENSWKMYRQVRCDDDAGTCVFVGEDSKSPFQRAFYEDSIADSEDLSKHSHSTSPSDPKHKYDDLACGSQELFPFLLKPTQFKMAHAFI